MSTLRLPLHAEHGPSISRAGALSGAMSINLLVIGALLLPAAIDQVQRGPSRAPEALTVVERVVEIAAAAAVPSPPPTPVSRPAPAPQPPIPVPAPPQLQPVVVNTPGPPVAVAPTPALEPSVPAAASSTPAGIDSTALAYIDAPLPAYPLLAKRKGWEGTVLLQVRVDARGRPVSVEVLRSSGHRVLDEAARRAVAATWTFRPALRDGLPVEAVGKVPVAFSLGRG
jgi:protein TonB